MIGARFITLLLGIITYVDSAQAADQVPSLPLSHREFMQACLQSGGMTGYKPTVGTADIYQPGAARKIDLSILTLPGKITSVIWITSSGKSVTTQMFGATSMSIVSSSVKLSFGEVTEISWCAHIG